MCHLEGESELAEGETLTIGGMFHQAFSRLYCPQKLMSLRQGALIGEVEVWELWEDTA